MRGCWGGGGNQQGLDRLDRRKGWSGRSPAADPVEGRARGGQSVTPSLSALRPHGGQSVTHRFCAECETSISDSVNPRNAGCPADSRAAAHGRAECRAAQVDRRVVQEAPTGATERRRTAEQALPALPRPGAARAQVRKGRAARSCVRASLWRSTGVGPQRLTGRISLCCMK